MKKYVCSACGWVYDPEEGVPDEDIAPEHHLKIFQTISFVLSVVLVKKILNLKNKSLVNVY